VTAPDSLGIPSWTTPTALLANDKLAIFYATAFFIYTLAFVRDHLAAAA